MRRYRHFHRKEKKQPSSKVFFIVREIIITVAEAVFIVFAAYMVTTHTLQKSPVTSDSMYPTLKQGDTVIINKFAYRFSAPAREDVIVYKQAGREHSYLEMSRVIGLPGEKVNINNGVIYINGVPISENINVSAIKNSGLAEDGVTLSGDEYFVLDDNRNHSEDSRFANVGNILKSDIIGKAWAVEKPFALVSGLNRKNDSSLAESEDKKDTDTVSSQIAKE